MNHLHKSLILLQNLSLHKKVLNEEQRECLQLCPQCIQKQLVFFPRVSRKPVSLKLPYEYLSASTLWTRIVPYVHTCRIEAFGLILSASISTLTQRRNTLSTSTLELLVMSTRHLRGQSNLLHCSIHLFSYNLPRYIIEEVEHLNNYQYQKCSLHLDICHVTTRSDSLPSRERSGTRGKYRTMRKQIRAAPIPTLDTA